MAADTPTPDEAPRPKMRRTWPQRFLIGGLGLASISTVAAAGLVWFVQQQLEDRTIVVIEPAAAEASAEVNDAGDDDAITPVGADGTDDLDLNEDENATPAEPGAPVETFPPAEPGARNILVTGADNNSCLDPDSRFAPAFGDREGLGERSDTIMMWRINPAANQVAVLSFPRDLWVTIDGRSSKSRINAAYTRDDPQRLINTIRQNFGIDTDHFVQVDFCAFKELVEAVDGVAVPFSTPVRDGATGLAVPEAGCFTFDGEHALAYVRSRKIEYQDANGTWQRDPTSDLGRISRQQDFIRRVADELLANAFSPSVVRSLLDVGQDYIVTDNELTGNKILEFAGVLQNTDPADITTYQIEARGTTIQGNAVLEPRLGGENMQAVLALFRGEVTLAQAPEQDLSSPTDTAEVSVGAAPGTTVPVLDPDVTTTTTAEDAAPPSTEEAVPFETIPEVTVEQDPFGVVPDGEVSCT